jgi:hypothetical protein
MSNERESKGGLPLGVQRVTLGDSVTLSDSDPVFITQTASLLKKGPTGSSETSANYQCTLRFIRAKDSLRCSGGLKQGTKFQW